MQSRQKVGKSGGASSTAPLLWTSHKSDTVIPEPPYTPQYFADLAVLLLPPPPKLFHLPASLRYSTQNVLLVGKTVTLFFFSNFPVL